MSCDFNRNAGHTAIWIKTNKKFPHLLQYPVPQLIPHRRSMNRLIPGHNLFLGYPMKPFALILFSAMIFAAPAWGDDTTVDPKVQRLEKIVQIHNQMIHNLLKKFDIPAMDQLTQEIIDLKIKVADLETELNAQKKAIEKLQDNSKPSIIFHPSIPPKPDPSPFPPKPPLIIEDNCKPSTMPHCANPYVATCTSFGWHCEKLDFDPVFDPLDFQDLGDFNP